MVGLLCSVPVKHGATSTQALSLAMPSSEPARSALAQLSRHTLPEAAERLVSGQARKCSKLFAEHEYTLSKGLG